MHEAQKEILRYNRRVEQACPWEDLMKWKQVKAIFYTLVASGAFYLTTMNVENQLAAFGVFMSTLILLYYGVESNEIQFAGLLTVILNGEPNDNGDEE